MSHDQRFGHLPIIQAWPKRWSKPEPEAFAGAMNSAEIYLYEDLKIQKNLYFFFEAGLIIIFV